MKSRLIIFPSSGPRGSLLRKSSFRSFSLDFRPTGSFPVLVDGSVETDDKEAGQLLYDWWADFEDLTVVAILEPDTTIASTRVRISRIEYSMPSGSGSIATARAYLQST